MRISDWSSDVCSSDLDGGMEAGIARLDDPATRRRAIADMQTKGDWENVLRMAGPDKATIAGVRTAALRPLIGRTLADIARERGISPEAAAIELVVADRGRVDTIYETMSEANLRRALAWPFTAVGSDAPAIAAEGAFLNSKAHPRTYGRDRKSTRLNSSH